ETASGIIAVRDTKPKEAKLKVLNERLAASKALREELEERLREKEAEDALEEERRADKIRQLRALNTVHKKRIKVFDPTETAGTGVMDEMSYMEMKERLDMVRVRDATVVANKREEIMELKEKKAQTLNEKAEGIMRARKLKNDATRTASQRRKEQERKEAETKEKARAAAAELLETDLRSKREAKKEEQEALMAEAERVKRQQQYLGAAMGRVDETRAEQILLGQEREARALQAQVKEEAVKAERAIAADKLNRDKNRKLAMRSKKSDLSEKIKKQFGSAESLSRS
ncbi:CFAP99, partial [Symbiodinium microadriaticum]